MPNRDEGSRPKSLQAFITSLILGGIFALVACFLLLFLLSIAIMFEFVAEKNMSHICIIICALSSFIGGRFAVKRGGKSPHADMTGNGLWVLLALFSGGLLAGGFGPGKTKKRRVEKRR